MALKIALKPGERLILGNAVVTNGNTKCELLIENKVPILRHKDILTENDANSPCKKIYFVIQLMYMDEKNLVEYHGTYWKLVREVINAAPSTLLLIDQISQDILTSKYYQALKLAKKLIEYEEEVIGRASKCVEGLPKDPNGHPAGS